MSRAKCSLSCDTLLLLLTIAHALSPVSNNFSDLVACAFNLRIRMISVTALLLFYLSILAVCQRRHKDKDDAYVDLIALNLITEGCSPDSYYGYGIVEGSLEKCDKYEEAKSGGGEVSAEYEEIKCRTLRVHGRMVDGKCECKSGWKGPYCNEYNGCPAGFSLYNSVCTPNACQHNGTIAIGSKQIECICQAPWDGRNCERLACWRMAPKEHERRWRNARDRCRCADEYDGDNCDKVIACKNDGEVIDGRCECKDSFYGEVCEKKCPVGQT
ncbi:EGF-like domain-containing protein C02B10.3 [Toxocara canis]|uniref:EGF-like domain-containing protein C02B10.3 n=1 Tax=Toxocara canis TaxID=6265 RepID=A0A0B2VLT2_TOXCA|nr:EGF-like domain-containing protein C02B10.3 [Toxocara canis]